MNNFREETIKELILSSTYDKSINLDIIIVAKNNFNLFLNLINSIQSTSSNCKIHVYNNTNDNEIKNFCKSNNIFCLTSESNDGFVKPNNILFEKCNSKYIVLLNTDVILLEGWKELLISQLDLGYDCVGFQGSMLDKEGNGYGYYHGEDIDFISGWCLAIKTKKYKLFDENILFALCEDADFCLKLKSMGLKIKSTFCQFAKHIGGATYNSLNNNEKPKVDEYCKKNKEFICKKWNSFFHWR